ncbi:murein hydrolase activator EnvC [Sulfurovum sp.]|uniref:murein hydrolase activator EnvC family protein n=1 Tax=Sulfurovum sp. TaxID=1969726 RepID=UPI0025DE7EAB|nr:M23 family metallopeptidase [Sulfurovum sp.]
MTRIFLSFFILSALLFGASTTTKIKTSKKNLSLTMKDRKKTSRQLDKIAKDIKTAEKEIAVLSRKIDELEADQSKNEARYTVLQKELAGSKAAIEKTGRLLKKKKQKFISLLSEQFSVVFAMKQAQHEPTRDSIISSEIYKAYKKLNTQELNVLKKEISALRKRKKTKLALQVKTQKEIQRIVKKREAYAQKKAAKEKLVKKLALDEEKYNAKLAKIEDRQNDLRATLAKLNILHAQEVEEARKRAEARKEALRLERERKKRLRKEQALARAKAKTAKEALQRAKTEEARKKARLAAKKAEKEVKEVATRSNKQSERIKQINSSYKKEKTYVYRGGKTISPIRGAKLVKRYGTYVDPIYKIKIFNESVTLQTPVPNAKVQNVLNGKVVFAGKSSMLGKVVVVEHSGRMHTVYAGLSKIAPNIRVGRKIKKGYVIGKVSSKLIFEATKNSKHINPLKLIRL